jgi:hypothetical protein
MWVQLAVDYPCFARRIGDCFCRAYQISETLWRWEVWKTHTDYPLRLTRVGTSTARQCAMEAAENHVLASGKSS